MLIEKIGLAAMLEQTAEEASELAFACLKYARYLRGENRVYGYSEMDLKKKLTEEAADVDICITELLRGGRGASTIDLSDFASVRRDKLARMKKRLEEQIKLEERGNEVLERLKKKLEEKHSDIVPAPPEKSYRHVTDDVKLTRNAVEIGFIKPEPKEEEDTCENCEHKDECESRKKVANDYIDEMESVLNMLPKPGEDGFDAKFDERIRKKVDAVRNLKRALDIIGAVEQEDKEGKD